MLSSPAIQALLQDLYTVSGFRISIHDTDFNEVAAYPEDISGFCALLQQNPKAKLHCQFTDQDSFERVRHSGKIHLYKCRFGLWEATCPLYRNGILIGYLMMGQAKDRISNVEEEILSAAVPFSGDREAMAAELSKLPCLTRDEVVAFSNIMTLCAERMAFLIASPVPSADLAESAVRYINRNINKKLTVTHLCTTFHCSKSTLMKVFHASYGMTLGEYITDRRIAIAKELLRYTEDSVCEVARRCGFPDQGYFSKVFSAHVGCSPSEYRREPFRK